MRFTRIYLVAVGGGVALVTLLGLLQNAKETLRFEGKSAVQYLRGASAVFLIAMRAVVAGIEIHKVQLCALLFAGALGILTIGSGLSSFVSNPLRSGTFTVLLPMALILAWVSLPATWLEFNRKGTRTS